MVPDLFTLCKFFKISDLDSTPARAPPVPAVAPPLDVTEPVESSVEP